MSVPLLLCHPDELLQPEDEAHIPDARQQQKRAGPLQASQGERMVLAPSGFPSGRLASLQLPCYSRFWRLHPPPASAVEPCALCRILDVSKRCRLCGGRLSLWLFRFMYEGIGCLFCSWTRQGFCCVCVPPVWAPVTHKPSLSLWSLLTPRSITSGGSVTW